MTFLLWLFAIWGIALCLLITAWAIFCTPGRRTERRLEQMYPESFAVPEPARSGRARRRSASSPERSGGEIRHGERELR